MLTSSPELKTYYKGNGRIINFRATADIPGGTVIPFGPRIGIVEAPAEGVVKEGKLANLHLGGEWMIPKDGADAFVFGDGVVWDGTNSVMKAAGAATPHGYVSDYAGAAAGTTEIRVILV